MNENAEVKVWDPLVRIAHWLLVTSFFLAYITEDEWLGVHVYAGYIALGVVLLRIAWGLVGPRYARFSDFVKPPKVVLTYLTDVLRFRARRYLGHNPTGGAMIVFMLTALILTAISGIAAHGAEAGVGPMAGLQSVADDRLGEIIEEIHEWLANLTLLLVILHTGGVLVESLLHRENLVWAMFTGRKRPE
jgi:cytochrome b